MSFFTHIGIPSGLTSPEEELKLYGDAEQVALQVLLTEPVVSILPTFISADLQLGEMSENID